MLASCRMESLAKCVAVAHLCGGLAGRQKRHAAWWWWCPDDENAFARPRAVKLSHFVGPKLRTFETKAKQEATTMMQTLMRNGQAHEQDTNQANKANLSAAS